MSSRYSEEEAVQKPAGELLRAMGWDLVYAYNDEKLGMHGTLGRTSYREVVLRRELVDAVQERLAQLERWTEKPETQSVVRTLIRDELYRFLPQSYPDESIPAYRDEIYEYFYSRAA